MGRIQNVWKQVKDFFQKDSEDIRQINKVRFPHMLDSPFMSDQGSMSDAYGEQVRIHQDLIHRFRDYEQMDDYPEVASAFDIYADEATQPDFIRKAQVWVESDNDNVNADLNYVLHHQLKVQDWAWEATRYLCKYGNDYERIFVNENGVVATQPLPVASTRRVHDEMGELAGFVVSHRYANPGVTTSQFRGLINQRDSGHFNRDFRATRGAGDLMAFENWEVSHFRIVGKNRMSRYGYGVAESARWPFKRLTMMEDAAVVHKLTRAPSRYAFYVDTGEMPPQQAMQQVRKVRDMYKKQRIVNPKTNKLDTTFNPLAIDEDLFIPVHRERGEQVRVDTLQGSGYQSMEDVDYFRKKLGRALKIPSFAQDDQAQRQPLSFEDIRFASAIMRIQAAMTQGFRKILDVHLIATGRSPSDFPYKVMMTVPSAILELARIEVMSAKSDFMSRMQEHVSVRWMLVNLFGFSEQESVNLMVMREEERDMSSAAQTEREVQREKLMNKLRESKNLSEAEIKRVEKRLQAEDGRERLKEMHGSKGVSEQAYFAGRNDLDPTRVIEDMQRRDPELFNRLNQLRQMLEEIRAHSAFRRG